ncbi:hypothetical protein DX928_24045 [Bacillus swezeyi]|uniref:Uncharacterized protein n=1 Tax=Bacillus swezeyi TaxID=1925020 RepID=A0A5M8R9T2_9BACI|nr:hypothetical protein DX927_24360 [Bacillus swezeyi]KAA6471446.1 hypothetical protein DX928_24045 [Bacillus swezeyi]
MPGFRNAPLETFEERLMTSIQRRYPPLWIKVEETAVPFSKQSGTARQKASLSPDRGVFYMV